MQERDDRGSEQRKFKRINQHFMAKFQTISENPETWHTIFLRDLGAGGVLFNHDSELKPGDEINLSIIFPMSAAPIACSAMVVRTRSFHMPLKVYEIAACFTEADEAQQELIERAAEIFLSKKKRRFE